MAGGMTMAEAVEAFGGAAERERALAALQVVYDRLMDGRRGELTRLLDALAGRDAPAAVTLDDAATEYDLAVAEAAVLFGYALGRTDDLDLDTWAHRALAASVAAAGA